MCGTLTPSKIVNQSTAYGDLFLFQKRDDLRLFSSNQQLSGLRKKFENFENHKKCFRISQISVMCEKMRHNFVYMANAVENARRVD